MEYRTLDIGVIGGGLLGSAFAYGFSQRGLNVGLIDEGDNAVRTARGNFGLVWVQGKGKGMREYAQWSLKSANAWPIFSDDLFDLTGTGVDYHRPGGFHISVDEAELEQHVATLEQLRSEAGEEGYDYELVQGQTLVQHLPGIGEQVPGATYCPHDGHVNPLRLLRALQEGFDRNGGSYLPLLGIDRIEPLNSGGFELFSKGRRVAGCEKLVIAAGHGSITLGNQVGIDVPIHPEQGQIIVTERSAESLAYPTNLVRQTDEGGFMLGPSARDVGFDADTNTGTLQEIVRRCSTAFPYLRGLRIQRSWAALRIMTPDGFPVYSQSEEFPGAFAFSCHSGVTLAAVHAKDVCQWVLDGAIPSAYQCFGSRRFDVSAAN